MYTTSVVGSHLSLVLENTAQPVESPVHLHVPIIIQRVLIIWDLLWSCEGVVCASSTLFLGAWVDIMKSLQRPGKCVERSIHVALALLISTKIPSLRMRSTM